MTFAWFSFLYFYQVLVQYTVLVQVLDRSMVQSGQRTIIKLKSKLRPDEGQLWAVLGNWYWSYVRKFLIKTNNIFDLKLLFDFRVIIKQNSYCTQNYYDVLSLESSEKFLSS